MNDLSVINCSSFVSDHACFEGRDRREPIGEEIWCEKVIYFTHQRKGPTGGSKKGEDDVKKLYFIHSRKEVGGSQ